MMKFPLIPLVLAFAAAAGTVGTASAAGNCDALRSQIEAKIATSGVANFAVTIVDAGAASGTRGKVVGSCEMGAKSIVYQQMDAPSSSTMSGSGSATAGTPAAVPRAKKDVILTECKDGSVSAGGDCKK
jgi:hypothetical protein